MKDAIALVPLAALLLALLSSAGGFYFYWTGSIRKRYAAEREFEHLRRNQEQIIHMITLLDDEVNDLKTEIIRLAASSDRH